jgi:NAD+ kinase
MRRILVLGDDREQACEAVEALGLEVVRSDPELVLCHGGDGTLLRAERLAPLIPKLPVRIRRHTRHCPDHDLATMLERMLQGELAEERLDRIELTVGRATFHAINDVVLRNENPALATRFRLVVDGRPGDVITGDGLVVATPFGSTGYYRSITRESISSGLAVAFNNTTRPEPPLLLDAATELRVEVDRGPAVLVHDNDTRTVPLRAGHSFGLKRSDVQAQLLGLDSLRCQQCRRHDQGTFNPH